MMSNHLGTRLGGVLLTALALLVACGGTSIVENGDGGSGGSGATGGAGTGASGGGTGGNGLGACDGPAQCSLVYANCCGVCSESTLADVTSVRQGNESAYQTAACQAEGNPPCPGCAGWTGDDLFTYCDAGSCTAADVRLHEVSACSDNNDCQLRYGLDCCPGCAPSNEGPTPYYGLVAVSRQGEQLLEELTCAPDSFGCPDCAPQFPPEAFPVCNQGHCEVALAQP